MKPTVSAEWINHEAAAIERSANDSLNAWILLGQSEKFSAEMRKVSALRDIAMVKSIASRRYRLREIGYAA